MTKLLRSVMLFLYENNMSKRIRHPEWVYKPKQGTLYRCYLDTYPNDTQADWHEFLNNLFNTWRMHVPWTSNTLIINTYGHLEGTYETHRQR
jgi:hypothetical protein